MKTVSVRVLVCGGRDLDETEGVRWLTKNAVRAVARLLRIPTENVHIVCVIQGKARGGDAAGERWADNTGIPTDDYPADWKTHGRAAGAIRNRQMLDEGKPDVCIALPGGTGTANMISQCRKAGVPVHVVKHG